jgi:hypothetical protein
MELRLENIVAIAIGAVVCGSTAPYTLIPLEAAAVKACKNVSPRVRNPIERTAREIYDSVITTGEMTRRFFYPDSLLKQGRYR